MIKYFFLSSILVFLSSSLLLGQIDYDEYKSSTKSVLIENVLIVKDAQSNPTMGSILIRDGKIEKIGKGIKAPFDSRTIRADSMYAYPAFIAGLSEAGLDKPSEDEQKKKPKVKFPGAPGNAAAGITPEKEAFALYNSKESSIKNFREAGFAIAQSVPTGKMLPGTSAIFSLTGGKRSEVMINKHNDIYSQFKGSSGVYPATVIAIMAKWRDLYRNAELAGNYVNDYKNNPTAGQRPQYDDAIRALIPVAQKSKDVIFKTKNAKETFRALELQKELGFNIILAELKQGWRTLDEIKTSGAGVLLSLKLPKKIEEEEKEDEQAKNSEEIIQLEKRKKKSYEEHLGQAAYFENENVQFGFSFLETGPKDLKESLNRMIEAGLSKKKALEALTSYPAKLLGIEKTAGSLEQSKDANIMITSKDYFEEKSKIRYMFIEGNMYEYKEKPKKKKSKDGEDEDLIDLVGKWNYKVDVFGEEESGYILIKGKDDDMTISLYSDDEPDDPAIAEDIERDGNNLTFNFEADTDEGPLNFSADLDFDEDDFKGNIIAPFGSLPMTGSKVTPK